MCGKPLRFFRRRIDSDGDDRPIIVFYNSFFKTPVDTGALAASCAGCRFTNDRRLISRAAAVVFHIPSLRRRSLRRRIRIRKRPGQLWAAWSMESDVNYPVLADRDYMRRFDITISYRRDSTIWCPYLPGEEAFDRALSAPVPAKTAAAPCAFFQSAKLDRCGRNRYAADLMRHMDIHSYGKFLNNREIGDQDRGSETKQSIISAYKFCLAFENSIAPDYVTEKFFDPFLAGTVPVYRGAANVADFAPGPSSYIDAADFAGPRELAAYLAYLDGNDAAYGAHLAWRREGLSRSYRDLLSLFSGGTFPRLCEIVRDRWMAKDRA